MGFRLSNARYEEIKKIVVELFIKYNIDSVSIDCFELASRMNIKVIPYSKFSCEIQELMLKKSNDGFFIEKQDNEFYIYYNDIGIISKGRINNTILHEIGHIVLGHTEESELAEAEVNFFAKYALVPPPLVHRLKSDNIFDIMSNFNVSLTAAYNAYNYYQKWLNYGSKDYTDYEMDLLEQFRKFIDLKVVVLWV